LVNKQNYELIGLRVVFVREQC